MMVGIGKRPAANYKFDPLPLALAQAGSYCTDIWNEKEAGQIQESPTL